MNSIILEIIEVKLWLQRRHNTKHSNSSTHEHRPEAASGTKPDGRKLMIKLEEFLNHIPPNRIFLLLKNFFNFQKIWKNHYYDTRINCVPKTFFFL